MSKLRIQANVSGTGVISIEAPNTNINRTINLPDNDGTFLMTDGDGSSLTSLSSANLTGALPAISGASLTDLPGGAYTNHETFTSSGTWTRPAGVDKVMIMSSGGSGGGGGSTGNALGNGKEGGVGGNSNLDIAVFTVSGNLTVTIGAGGTGADGASGSTGGTTSITGTGVSMTSAGGGGGFSTDINTLGQHGNPPAAGTYTVFRGGGQYGGQGADATPGINTTTSGFDGYTGNCIIYWSE